MKKIALILTCFAAITLKGQVNNFNQSPVTLQSPDATQFIRYGNIPMDYSTGVPNISIPLYTVSSGKLSLPIDISYNASGIKVQDVASTIGLGWSLNAGGLISRTILGTDDQLNENKPFLSSNDVAVAISQSVSNLTGCANFIDNNVGQIFSGLKESQSDRYFYSFNGRSGIFRFDFQTGMVKTIPYSPLKISAGVNNVGPYKITTEDGTNFYFEQPEFSMSQPGYGGNLSYYLTKIESADLTHVINIYYKQDNSVTQYIKSYQLDYRRDVSEHSASYPTIITLQTRDNEFVNVTNPVMLDKITSDNETIQFEYIADRPDLRKSRLQKIKISNSQTQELIKIIEFEQSYFGTTADNNQRLRLDKLNFKTNSNATINQYSFAYDNSYFPPYYHQLGMNEHHHVDYWGYYNGTDNPSLLPKELFVYGNSFFTTSDANGFGGDRNPNPWTVQSCMLKEIKYPTGGKTTFEYESNRVPYGYSYSNMNIPEDYFGGLRIKKITSTHDALSNPIVKSYTYSEASFTRIEPLLYQHNINSIRWGPESLNTMNQRGDVDGSTIYSDPLISMSTGSGPVVAYNKIIEYDGTEFANNGYTEYHYQNTNIPYYIYDPGTVGNPYLNGYYHTDFGNYKPQMSSKILFGKDQNNAYKQIRREDYLYDNFNTGNFIAGVKIQRNFPFIKLGDYATRQDCDFTTGGTGGQITLGWLFSQYEYSNILGILDVPLLTQKRETINELNGTGSLLTTTNYTYDLTTLQPIQTSVINSKGESLISVSKYPTDFPSQAPYNTMAVRNILTPVVEQTSYKSSISSQNVLNSTKTNYDYWNGTNWSTAATNIIVPRTVDTKAKDQATYETRMQFYSYDDKGNPTSVSKEKDVKKTYLWGYNKTYPVAEIIGADLATAQSFVTQSILDNPTNDGVLRNHLNNLRLNIPNAQVTTYTYKPLVGMTSATDPRGRITYYDYDAFNRLILIRDHNNKVLKKICYNYAGQPEDCQVVAPYYNDEASQVFTRNNCAACSVGSQVTYTVPSGTYSASTIQAANQLAQNDIAANGQAYANANGSCTINSNIQITYDNVAAMASGFTVVYTGSNGTYTFSIPSNGTGVLGCIPPGTYTINISKPGNTDIFTFDVGCATYSGTSGYFKFRNVSSSTCNIVKLYGAL